MTTPLGRDVGDVTAVTDREREVALEAEDQRRAQERERGLARRRRITEQLQGEGLVLVLIVVFVVMWVSSQFFLTEPNLLTAASVVSVLGVMAVAETLLVISGEIDISIGSVMAATSVLMGLMVGDGINVWLAAIIGLLFSGTGVVFSAYQTLNHVAAVPYRLRAGFVSRYLRVFLILAMLLLGALGAGTLTVVATALPSQPGVQRAAAVLGSALVVFTVLLLGSKTLLTRPTPVRALWPGAILGAAAVTAVLNVGAPLLARLVTKAGAVYGSFATVAGMFALLYLVSQALVYAAEVSAVRYARLWPRALDVSRPTAADARALALLAREQERIPAARVQFHLATQDPAPVPGNSPPAESG